MSSYRRYVAQHGAAVHRAKQQVRRHAWETGPTFPDAIEKDLGDQTFQQFLRGLGKISLVLQSVPLPKPLFAVVERPVNNPFPKPVAEPVWNLFPRKDPWLKQADAESWQHRERGCTGAWELHTDGRHRRCAECREPMRPLGHGEAQPAWAEPDPVLAYRSKFSHSLYCTTCSGAGHFGIPLTSDDLPDGGLCASCGRDVMIVTPAITPAECIACTHPHVEGQECTVDVGPGYCGCDS